ncbi:MAG: hypothetical protein AMJ43_04300 [Coxiella sp. DG_40]|nr:MAG: hypothetical protein AMJ43_04300 [Coxiella sp. DG_40]
MKIFFSSLISVLFLNLLFVNTAKAVCPLCTVAVGAGIGLTEWLGIDDTITGLWIGGLIVSLIIWTMYWLDKKNIRFRGRKVIVSLAYYLIIVVPLYPLGVMGNPLNTLWGIDKLLLGIVLGSIFFFMAGMWYFYLKKRNNGRAYFPFQKVVMPVAPLLILSAFFYFITR